MRFDYLHSAKPLLIQRLLELRIPERFYNAFLALMAAIAVTGGAWAIEAYRLREALKTQAVYQAHFDATQRQLARANVYYTRVRTLMDLDKRVRKIASSGDTDARTLAEIANRLPPHSWLTGISHDDTGLALEGRAKDLSVVSSVMRALIGGKHLRNPMLQTASFDKQREQDADMKYEIHVDAGDEP